MLCEALVMYVFHAVPMLSVILLILGVVLSAVLWMSVGFHVGLQESELIGYKSHQNFLIVFFRHMQSSLATD